MLERARVSVAVEAVPSPAECRVGWCCAPPMLCREHFNCWPGAGPPPCPSPSSPWRPEWPLCSFSFISVCLIILLCEVYAWLQKKKNPGSYNGKSKSLIPTVSVHMLACHVCVHTCISAWTDNFVCSSLTYLISFMSSGHHFLSVLEFPPLFLMALFYFYAIICLVFPGVHIRLLLTFCLSQEVLQTSLHKHL